MLLASLGMAATGSAQVTFRAVEGSDWGNDEGSDKVRDGNTATKWCKNGDDDETKCYVILEASEATYIQGFKMTTANDNDKNPGRTPKTYTLSGCDTQDGTYETIYYQADDNLIGDVNFKEYTIYCNSQKKYKYFKLWIKDSNINGGRMFQLSEFTLIPSTMGFTYKDGKQNAVDGKTSEKWEANPSTSVTVEASEPTYLTGYQFTTGNDNSQYKGRNPGDWKIEGSNDCSEWHEVVSVTGNQDMQEVNYVPYYFPLDNPLDVAYKYYRVTVTRAQGGGYFQMSEMSLVGTTVAHTWVEGDNVAPTCTQDGYETYRCSDCGAVKGRGVIPMLGHQYSDKGLCVRCAYPQADWMTANEGWYEAASLDHFNWLAAMVKNVNPSLNIRLTQDVDLDGFQGFGNGSEAVAYKGELDGQGHWLKNLILEENAQNVGLFGRTDGAKIHDLGLTGCSVKSGQQQNSGVVAGNMKDTEVNRVAVMNSFSESRDHAGAIAGRTEGTTKITNCLSDAQVHATQYQAGGMVGASVGMTFDRNLFTGTVVNEDQASAGLVSLLDNPTNGDIYIRYNISAASLVQSKKSDNVYPVIQESRHDLCKEYDNNRVAKSMVLQRKNSVRENLFNTNDYNGFTTEDADMQVKSFYTDTMKWDMTADWKFVATGKYPVLAWMTAPGAQDIRVSQAGYATVTAAGPLDFSETKVKAYAAQLSGKWVHLEPVTQVPAGAAVVVEATQGEYSVPFAVEKLAAMPQNDLQTSDGTVKGGSSVFVLGNKANGVGFYPTAESLTLPAGKGYLEISSAAEVQAFLGFGDGTGTGITSTVEDTDGNAAIYNLAGQRVSRVQKGVNIVNGKKVIY